MNNFECVSEVNGKCRERNFTWRKGHKSEMCPLSESDTPCNRCIFKDYGNEPRCQMCKYRTE